MVGNAKLMSQPLRIICHIQLTRQVPPPNQVVKLKIGPFANIRSLTSDFLISSSTIIPVHHARQQFAFIDKTKVPKSSQHILLDHSFFPAS